MSSRNSVRLVCWSWGLGSNGTENRDKVEKSLRIIVFRIDAALIFAWIDGVCGPQSTDSPRRVHGLLLIEAYTTSAVAIMDTQLDTLTLAATLLAIERGVHPLSYRRGWGAVEGYCAELRFCRPEEADRLAGRLAVRAAHWAVQLGCPVAKVQALAGQLRGSAELRAAA